MKARLAAFRDGDFSRRVMLSGLLFLCAATVNFYAGTYATREVSSSVTDIVLSNVPVYDVDVFFVYGAMILIAFIAYVCVMKPMRIPFVLFSLSTFVFIRSGFITLTHIAPYPDRVALNLGEITSKFLFGGDLFFSGHTGIPFLMALVFWRTPVLRYIFLTWSAFFGVTALLGHIHYSIDVASAYFITFTIYNIASYLFPKEKALLEAQA